MLKRIRRGAYECMDFIVQYTPWTNEQWDGSRATYRGWKVYRSGSFIEKRVLVDAFPTRRLAYDYVQRQLDLPRPSAIEG